MRVRTLLIVTALLSSVLGAVVAYLVLTVPNDVQAAALMKAARRQIAAGQNDLARQSLSRIVQQYPRTDAAAAATVALASIADSERHTMLSQIESLRRESAGQQKQIADLTQRVADLAARPIPQPVIVQVPEKKPPAKKPPAKKAATKRSSRRRGR